MLQQRSTEHFNIQQQQKPKALLISDKTLLDLIILGHRENHIFLLLF